MRVHSPWPATGLTSGIETARYPSTVTTMPLTSFGAVLNFAESLEKDDLAFYNRAADAADTDPVRRCYAEMAREAKKNVSLVQRTRRENVTEMILEPIRDLLRDSYTVTVGDIHRMDAPALRSAAAALENRAIRYYDDAAERIRALPEVSRTLKTLAKKRRRRLDRLQGTVR